MRQHEHLHQETVACAATALRCGRLLPPRKHRVTHKMHKRRDVITPT